MCRCRVLPATMPADFICSIPYMPLQTPFHGNFPTKWLIAILQSEHYGLWLHNSFSGYNTWQSIFPMPLGCAIQIKPCGVDLWCKVWYGAVINSEQAGIRSSSGHIDMWNNGPVSYFSQLPVSDSVIIPNLQGKTKTNTKLWYKEETSQKYGARKS